MPDRMLPNHPQQMTLFVKATKEVSFGAAAAWKERNGWKTKAIPLGKYLTEAEAALFAVGMVMKDLLSILSRADYQRAEIVTESLPALTAVQSVKQWSLPIITDIKRQARRVDEAGGWVALTWLPSNIDSEGHKIADAAAQRVARQQPKEMRSASLSYVQQSVRERWRQETKINKHIKDAKKSTTAQYLQLKSGHAITGAHLLRISKVQDARCWWCDDSRQTVAHLVLECRKWRRERDVMLGELKADKITISERRDRTDLETLFGEEAMTAVLQFIETTEVGRKRTEGTDGCDSWDIDRLDYDGDGE